MKLTARIKRKTSPLAKLIRRLTAKRPMIFVDPMGDALILKRVMTTARKAGRTQDFCRVTV